MTLQKLLEKQAKIEEEIGYQKRRINECKEQEAKIWDTIQGKSFEFRMRYDDALDYLGRQIRDARAEITRLERMRASLLS